MEHVKAACEISPLLISSFIRSQDVQQLCKADYDSFYKDMHCEGSKDGEDEGQCPGKKQELCRKMD